MLPPVMFSIDYNQLVLNDFENSKREFDNKKRLKALANDIGRLRNGMIRDGHISPCGKRHLSQSVWMEQSWELR